MLKVNTLVGGLVRTNCYILENEKKECLIIDIPEFTGGKAAELVKSRELNPLAILVTHGHFDHTFGVNEFIKSFPLAVYGNTIDNGKKVRIFPGKVCNAITHDAADGEMLKFGGFEVKVLHTPGHSAGSVCYIVENYIFTGDTLFAGNCGRTDFDDGSDGQMEQSLKRLHGLEGDYIVCPGHMGSSTLEKERISNPYFKF